MAYGAMVTGMEKGVVGKEGSGFLVEAWQSSKDAKAKLTKLIGYGLDPSVAVRYFSRKTGQIQLSERHT